MSPDSIIQYREFHTASCKILATTANCPIRDFHERERKHSREFYKKISQELKFTWNFPICFPRDLLDAVENKEISREFHAGHNCLQYNRQKTLIRLTVHVYKFKFSFEKVNVCKCRSIMGTGNCGLKLHALRFRFAKITFVIQG